MKILKLTILSLIVTLYGCGGGSSSSETESTKTGVFLDSPVSNIGYRTETKEGVTNAQGEYEYVSGETVTFFIGDLEFPPVTAAGVVTPLNIADTQDTSDPVVVNMIRLLQTLDKNGNPDDGIEIAELAKQNATQVDFTLDAAAFEASNAVDSLVNNGGQDSGGISLISIDDAIAHFEGELADAGLFNPLHGTWISNFSGNTRFTFSSDTYIQCDGADPTTGVCPTIESMEIGTYTLNNGAMMVTSHIVNGPGGLDAAGGVEPLDTPVGVAINGSVLTLTIVGEGDFSFTKIE